MKLLEHKKIFENLETKETIVKLSLNCNNDEIDNIIYYLICAQEKINSGDKFAFDSRIDAAFTKLRNYIKN